MKKIILISIFMFLLTAITHAQQVPLNTVVEYFTNTKCSNCASRNPGFISNFNSNANTLYMAVYPSSPYPACPLSMQNPIDNDARTNYYGIYGATPRLVINGTVISGGANYSLASIFTPYLGLTSSFVVNVSQSKTTFDTLQTTVVIKKVDTSSLTSANLFLGIVEDTVFINGGNGELEHYYVLRDAPLSSSGIVTTLPSTLNDSTILTKTTFVEGAWNLSRMASVAILQNSSTKKLIQANRTKVLGTVAAGIQNSEHKINAIIYPNPCAGSLYVSNEGTNNTNYEIFDLMGKSLLQGSTMNDQQIDVTSLDAGAYLFKFGKTDDYHTKFLYIVK